MAAGQRNNVEVGFIIQARMRSARLPGKVLLPLPLNGGRPIIRWIVDSVSKTRFNSTIILATSLNKENDPLEDYCNKEGIICFRGDEDDVLSRFWGIIDKFSFDVIVRLTADNPLVDLDLLEQTIDVHLRNRNAYTYTHALPTGMNFEIISPSALDQLRNKKLSTADKEHVTTYLRNHEECKKELVNFRVNPFIKKMRLTVDYVSDFLVLDAVSSLLDRSKNLLEALEDLYLKYPWIFEGNVSNFQKKEFTNFSDEKAEALKVLEQLKMTRVCAALNKLSNDQKV